MQNPLVIFFCLALARFFVIITITMLVVCMPDAAWGPS